MERNKVDAFLVCVGCEYYSNPEEYLQVGDYVCITSRNTVLKNGKQMGSIALQDKYYDRAVDLLDMMTSQNTLQLKGDEYAILEIELKDIHDDIDLPPFEIVKEVTNDKNYRNYEIAKTLTL